MTEASPARKKAPFRLNAVKWQSSIASRFIGELPGEHLEKLAGGPLSGRGGWRDEMEEILYQAKKRAEASPSPLFAQYEGQKLKPGQPVKHPTFGIGVIRRIDGDILHIIFKRVGEKKVLMEYVEEA